MRDKKFDDIIKRKLDKFEVDNISPDWERMQSLIEIEKSDLAFDKVVKDKLIYAESYSPSASWENFQKRRAVYRERRNQIIKTRIVESFILLLLIWATNYFLLPEFQNKNKYSTPDIKTPSVSHPEKSLNHKNIVSSVILSNLPVGAEYATKSSQINFSNPNSHTSSRKVKKESQNQIIPNSVLAEQTPTLSLVSSSNSQLSSSVLNQAILSNTKAQDLKIETNEIIHTSSDLMVDKPAPFDNMNVSNTSVQLLTKSLVHLANGNSDLPNLIDALPNLFPLELAYTPETGIHTIKNPGIGIKKTQIPKFILSVYSGVTALHVSTPSQQTLSESTKKYWGTSYLLGMSGLVQHGKWYVGTGLEYKHISYSPSMNETVGDFKNGYYMTVFDKINYDIINIPILLYCNLIQGPNFNLIGKFGTGISINLKSQFNIQNQSTTAASVPPFTTNFDGYSALAAKAYDPGLAAGGGFGDNAFLNINFGLKSELQIRKKTLLFAEVNSDLMLNALGFGPNKDQFKGIGMMLGLSTKL